MKPILYILIATALTYLVSYALGAALIRALKVKLYRSEERFFAFIAGSACLSTLIFLLTAVGLARKWVFLTVSALILGWAIWKRLYRAPTEDSPSAHWIWRIMFWGVYGVYTWLYLGHALAPEISADAISYHLALVARYAREHHFPIITTNMYASLSEGIEMLFLFAFTIGKHSAAKMCEFLYMLTLPFGIIAYGRRIGHPAAATLAAVMVYASPVFGTVGVISHNDVAGVAVVFAVFYAVQLWREHQDSGTLMLAGILAGFAYAVKYTLGIAVLYAVAAVILVGWKRKQSWLKPAVVMALCSFAVMAPWLIKNVVEVSNPFSPFFNRLFPNPYIMQSFEQEYVQFMSHFNGVKLWEVPWEVTVRGERLQGLLGPLFLLAPVGLIALRYPAGRQIWMAAAVFLLPYFGNLGTRFLMPIAPFVSLTLGMTLDAFPPLVAVALLLHSYLSWPHVVPRYAGRDAWRIERSAWKTALRRQQSEADYLRESMSDYTMGQLIEGVVPRGELVLSPSMGDQTYHSREIIVPYQSAFGNRIYDVLFRAATDDMQPALRYSFTFPGREVQRVRLVMAKASKLLPWIVSEMRVFSGTREIERSPQWRLRASIDPWRVRDAFDNSPVTTWTSDRSAAPGMFLQIDFGHRERIDKVTVDVPRNLDWVGMRVEGDGQVLSDKQTSEIVQWPQRMRRAATEELLANGIRWLVFKDDDLLADDLQMRSKQWGIRQIAVSNGFRLWRLE